VSAFQHLFAELFRRGWTDDDLRKLAGEDLLRAWREAEAVARCIRRERKSSTATIQELRGGGPW
jgi:membrane dipeptidase